MQYRNAFTETELELDRQTAREGADSAMNTSDILVYSDASEREGHPRAAILALEISFTSFSALLFVEQYLA